MEIFLAIVVLVLALSGLGQAIISRRQGEQIRILQLCVLGLLTTEQEKPVSAWDAYINKMWLTPAVEPDRKVINLEDWKNQKPAAPDNPEDFRKG